MMQNTTDSLNLAEFLQRYPWQQNETEGRSPADFLWRFEINAPVADLWPFLIDTSTFNRLLGLPQMKYTEKNGRLFGSSVNAGILSEWEEVPWEWEYHKGLNNARIYSRGFATYVRSRYLLRADGERTIFYVYFGWVPRTFWARWLLKIAMPRLQKDYAMALDKIVQILQTRKDFTARQRALLEQASPVTQNAQAEERLQVLTDKAIAEGAPKDALAQLSAYVLSAPDEALTRIRVKVAARELGLPVSDLVTAALYATRAGMLTLSWDVTCPHCRGVRQSVSSLGDIPKEERCDACDITFSSEELGNMEVVFHVNPEIRSVEKKFYCAAEPATKRHIRIQVRVPARKTLELDTDLEPGEYRARLMGDQHYLPLLIGEGDKNANLLIPGTAVKIQPAGRLSYTNAAAEDATLVIERRDEDNDALRPADLFSRQIFRDLYGTQSLAEGLKIELGNQNILFTDIVGSTDLYLKNGDGEAFSAVRRHFQKIYEITRTYNGAIVKTIGDSAMVAFADALQCIRAAVALQKAFTGSQETGGVLLRASIHSGPCIAVNLNSGIDYFGNTVNYAAKLQQLAGAREIAFSPEFFSDPHVKEYISQESLQSETRSFAPKWSEKPFEVFVVNGR